MAFQDTLTAMKSKHKLSNRKIAEIMGVAPSHVYRYLNGSSEPRWKSVLSLLGGLGYELKIVKKEE